MNDQLIIGKFCQLASGVRFLMNGANNHPIQAISTYPFNVMGASLAHASIETVSKGDTIIGNDVWIGNQATIMQGIKIGDGAIIGTNALVTKNVEPYTIVGGNPARVIRKRFTEEEISFLIDLAWWNWPIEKITQHVHLLRNNDFGSLKNL
jgi:virginiamycin A acetyltransferase